MSATDITTLVVAIIGAVTGIVGLGLSVWTIRRQIDDDRVKLRVGACWGMATVNPGVSFLVIDVTNLSKFPVTLTEVGLLCSNETRRAISPLAVTSRGEHLPVRMEPRTAVSVSFPPEFLREPDFRTATVAHAYTACGECVKSPKDIVPNMIETANANAAENQG